MISRFGGFLARGLTDMSDPTSGFMAFKKMLLHNVSLDPVGWKIILEITVKARPRFTEIPIVFAERKLGKNKFSIRVQIDYLRHLLRLYRYKYFK
jgi:dolichol-phosphate mannosyltransferase